MTFDSVFAQGSKDDQRHLSFMQLPSKLRGIPQLNWNVEVDFVIRDFGMDPSQDLLVLMEAGRTFVSIDGAFCSLLTEDDAGWMLPVRSPVSTSGRFHQEGGIRWLL